MKKPTLSENDIVPGTDCPVCGEQIVTYFARQSEADGEQHHGEYCTIDSEKVEPTGPMGDWPGDTIVIDHTGPSME